jgi:hypothetical protein
MPRVPKTLSIFTRKLRLRPSQYLLALAVLAWASGEESTSLMVVGYCSPEDANVIDFTVVYRFRQQQTCPCVHEE